MKKIIFFIAVLSMIPFIKISAQCAQTANIYTFTYNGHTYEIVKELKTWTNAAACAVERGGYLAQINDSLENVKLKSSITTAGISATYHPVIDGGGASYIWIGGNDINIEGTWVWEGSSEIFYYGQGTAGTGGGSVIGNNFINWGCSSACEPDNYFYIQDQDGLGLALGSWPYGVAGKWNDIDKGNTLYFIIEKNYIGINENKKTNKIELYPNPANNYIQINGIDDLNALIKIVNIDGKTIKEYSYSELSDNKINIENLPSGIYMVNIKSDNNTYVSRFVK